MSPSWKWAYHNISWTRTINFILQVATAHARPMRISTVGVAATIAALDVKALEPPDASGGMGGMGGLVGRPFDRQEHLSSVSPSRFRPMHWTPTHWSRCCQHLSIVFSVLMKEIWGAPIDRIISLVFAIRFDTKLVHDFHQYDGPRCKSVCIVKYGITKVASRYCDICIRIPMILLWSNLLANKEFWPDKAGTCPIAKAGRWGWCASDSHQGGDVLGSCTTASSFKDDKTLIYSNKNWIIFLFTVHHHYLLIHYCHLTIDRRNLTMLECFSSVWFWRWSSRGSKLQLREDCHPTIMTHQSIQHPSIKLKKKHHKISTINSKNHHKVHINGITNLMFLTYPTKNQQKSAKNQVVPSQFLWEAILALTPVATAASRRQLQPLEVNNCDVDPEILSQAKQRKTFKFEGMNMDESYL